MIVLDLEQGSAEWLAARRGIPTASNFDKIITNTTGKLSTSFDKYAFKLIAEQILGVSLDDASSGFMTRGSLMEKSAVDFYEYERECETTPVGFVLRDDRRVGCSPDRLVGDEGLLEIKCPAAATHIGYLLNDEGIGYKAQCQGQLWLTGRQWADTLSYHPELPPALVRVTRDEEFIEKLAGAVNQFLGFMDSAKLRLIRAGHFGADDLGVIPDLRVA